MSHFLCYILRVFALLSFFLFFEPCSAHAVPVGIRVTGDVTHENSFEIASPFSGYIIWDSEAVMDPDLPRFPLLAFFVYSPPFTSRFLSEPEAFRTIHIRYDSNDGSSQGHGVRGGIGHVGFQFTDDAGFGDTFDLNFLFLGPASRTFLFPAILVTSYLVGVEGSTQSMSELSSLRFQSLQ